MSLVVWKFSVPIADTSTVMIPRGAELIHFATQDPDDTPYVWAICNPNAPKVRRQFRLAGTGHPLLVSRSAKYIGTIHVQDRKLVFHLFDLGEEE